MVKTRITALGRVVSLFAFCLFAGISNGAAAQFTTPISTVYANSCSAGCHLSPLNSNNGLGVGKILAWPALDFTTGNVPQRMRDSAAGFGNGMSPANITARSDAELLQLQAYLLGARDGLSTPASLSFANTEVGQTTAAQTVSLGNLRNSAFTFNFSKAGTNSAAFSVTKGAGCGAGTTSGTISAATGATPQSAGVCTLNVTFSPAAAVGHSVNLNITFTGEAGTPGSSKTIALSGTGTPPPAPVFLYTPVADPSMSATVGTTTQKQIGTIRNTGNANLILGSLAFRGGAGSEFAVAGGGCRSNQTLTANSTCNMLVTFTPNATGARSDTLDIPHNAGSTQQVAVNGTGIAAPVATIGLDVTSLAFGRVALGSTSAPASFTIRNTGTAGMSVSGIPITQGAAEYSRSSGGSCPAALPFTVVAGSSCTVQMTYRPGAAGPSAAAQVRVESNASNGTPAPVITLTGFGLPHATVAPTVVEAFPQTIFGETSPTRRNVTVTNPRDRAIGYSRGFGGANAGDFAVVAGSETCATMQVPAGASCSLEVSFTPGAAGGESTRSASLQFTFTGTGGDAAPQPLSAAVSGVAIAPTPRFDISGISLALSTVVGSSNTGTLTISNTGTANLVLSTLTFGGAFAAEYALAAANTCTAGLSLPPGTTVASRCTLAVRFTPADVGTRTATLTIAHNATGSQQIVSLNGVATAAPVGTIDLGGQTGLTFGSAAVGTSLQQTLTVRNSGTAALNITGFAVSGTNASDFVRSGTCAAGSPVAVNATCTVVVTFTPSATGARTAMLAIASDASNAGIAAALTLNGTGVLLAEPVITPNPPEVFPATLIGELSSVTRIITVSNPRTNSISYSRLLTGGNAADFSVSNESCPTGAIASGASCTISLQFRPTAVGGATRNAVLSLSFTGSGGDAAPASPREVAISGLTSTLTPQFSISANSLDLSAVVGVGVDRTAIITNSGGAPLGLTSLAFSAGASSEFSFAPTNACNSTTVLAPSGSCSLVIRFTPTQLGTREASVSVAHTATGSPATLNLRGTGTLAAQGRIEFSSFSLAFADTQVGSTAQLSLTAANRGDAALTFGFISITGASASVFERGGTCQTGLVLQVNQDCQLTVTFRPAATGAQTATMSVNSDASNGAGSIALSGNGVAAAAPQISLPATLEFGTRTVGGLYPNRLVQIRNSGTSQLLLTSITVNGAGFAVTPDSTCTSSLAVGATCDVVISFAPPSVDTDFSGRLTVASNAAGSPHATALSGRGTAAAVPALAWTGGVTELVFGNTSAGTLSSTQTLTLRNAGPGGVLFRVLNAVGKDAAAFSISGGTCQLSLPNAPERPLFQGDSCTIEIRFSPASAGEKQATLQIASTGNFPPALSLRGTGLAGPSPTLALSLTAMTFESTRVGNQSQPVDLLLSSTGTGVIKVTSLETSGPYQVRSKTCPALPFTLTPGTECTVTVMFVPSGEGDGSGTLTITSDALAKPLVLMLNGQGEATVAVSSGGCSLVDGESATDPTLWLLVGLAAFALLYRRRTRAAQARADHRC